MRTRCPSCKKIVNVPRTCTDYIHSCVENPAIPVLQQEDVVQIGPWTDADGLTSATNTPPGLTKMPMIEGQIDILQGTQADYGPHERVPAYTPRGAPMDTTRQRNRYTYFTVKEGQTDADRPINPNFG